MNRAALAAALTAGLLSAFPGDARAAGLYFADRGVRPAARGGAFIAGGDDLGAVAYNPAGVFEAGSQFLFDASWVAFGSEYTRQALLRQVDPNTGETVATYLQTMDKVTGSSPVLPIPTIAASYQLNSQWVVWGGAWAPYAALASYPEQVNGRPAPQRYSLFTLDGSVLVFVGAGAAYKLSKEWRFGASLGALVGTFNNKVAFSGCVPERFFCAPEDPDWDILAELAVGPIVAPTGQLGALWQPSPRWRIGTAVQLPVYVRAPGKIRTRLAAAPVFEQAYQEGEDADVSFDLPWSVRFGVEARVLDNLRVELGLGYERWSMHDNILIEPQNVKLKNIAGFPAEYRVPDVVFPRNFTNSASVRLGSEYQFKALDTVWDARAGMSFELSAVPPEYLSVLTIDAPKLTLGAGFGVHLGRFRVDASFARVVAFDVTVAPEDARLPQVSPVQSNPAKNPNYINGGEYSAYANVIGLGVTYNFGSAPAEPAGPAQTASLRGSGL
jgi:long-chain fatty acid transport protein